MARSCRPAPKTGERTPRAALHARPGVTADLGGDLGQARLSFLAALANRDARGAASVYAPDAQLVLPAGELIVGRAEIEAFWRAGLDAGLVAVEFDVLKLERHDRFAYEVGRYVLYTEPGSGKRLADSGNYVLVHSERADGAWCRAVEMLGPDRPFSPRVQS